MIRSIAVFVAVAAAATATAPAAPTASPSPAGVRPSASAGVRPSPSRPPAPGRRPSPPPAAGGGGASFDLGVWTVHASSVDANFKNGDFSTPAQIVMTRNGGDVTADRANGNYKKQMVYLNGHVVMHDTQGNYGGLGGSSGSSNNGPSTLTADKAQIDGGAKEYKAIGNVHYVQADTVVDADNGTLNESTHDLFLQGNVRIVQGARKINAQSVVYNTVTAKAHAQGDVTMQFPGQLHRGLATPKPLRVPKNGFTQDVTPAPRPS
jgi:lipopolysaccharide assembly outer membrane protein LptD (OstA)